ncbi:hypothetical protein CLOM_g5043 [Closterium sp. NIES-68]|nr:hypothetical protein CLOM_g5043 [Closterium sp. NIES-68]GJP67773.1 hypothetical protein CLOP_g24546 [Closterium sp. NIES-67]GJP70043.1 hypothetical protein CLOP_g1036 [Closterium sp. NIES-67]
MPYVPPHKRAGASSSGSEPPSGTAAGHAGSAPGSESRFGRGRGRGRGQAGGRGKNHAANKISIKNSRDVVLATVIDDYAERESSVTGTPCSSSCACNGGKSRCNRMRLRFQPFKGRSYLHLQGQNLSLLKRAPDSDVDHIESPEIEYTPPPADSPSFATSAAPTAIPATPATIHPASDASASAAFPLPITTPASLFDAVAGPLLKGLEAAHKEMEFAAQSQLRKSSLDRCKLVVRLGKLLFGPPFGSPESLLPGLPPFTAGAFESNLNRQAQRLPVRVHRSLETGMPEPLFQAVEGIVMGGEGGSVQTKETYHIRVVDTDQMDTEYKLICKPDPDGSGVILVKVKHNPLRYAVVDVSRPAKAIDFRLMLATDTRLCSLDVSHESSDPWGTQTEMRPPSQPVSA